MDLMKLCRPGNTRCEGLASRPWLVHVGDRAFTCVTNGSHLLFVRGQHTDPAPVPPIVLTKLSPFLADLERDYLASYRLADGSTKVEGCERLLLADLREWCGPSSPRVTCPECAGEGFTLQSGDCPECRGQGGLGGEEIPGVLYGQRIDRNALGLFLAEVTSPAGECYFRRTELAPSSYKNDPDGRALQLHGNGWALYFMPVSRWDSYELADKNVTRFDQEYPMQTAWGRVD